MALKPCLDCGTLSQGSRCPDHARARDRIRVARRGRIYKGDWQARARQQVSDEPWCAWCGASTDLVADHVVAGDPASPTQTLCRSCNSIKANRERWHGGGR